MRHFVFPINALPSIQMVQAGIDDILWNGDLKFEALKRYYERVEGDILFYFSDIAIQAEAMGAKVSYSKKGMPAIHSLAQSISVSDPAEVPRMRVNGQVLKRMEKEFPDKLRAALVYGPFTVAGQIAGEERLLRGLMDSTGEIFGLLEKTFECARIYANYLTEAGANLIWVSDPLSSLIPPDQFWKYSGIYLKRLFELFSSLPIILHICGDTYNIIHEMVRTGVSGISFDNCMDLLAVEDEIPDDVFIIGNIDPVEVIELGSQDDVIASTSDLVSTMALKDNFALSTGCAVPPFAPLENIRLFVDTARKVFTDIEPDVAHLSQLNRDVYSFDFERVGKSVMRSLNAGIDPLKIITGGLMRAIRKGSAMYELKRCYLPSILLMVDAFNKGLYLLKNKLDRGKPEKPDIILGTVKGDVHEIGKNLVRIFLETHGYSVVDLGVDVDTYAFIKAYQEHRPLIVGLSAFTTESRKEMEKMIHTFHREGIKEAFIIIGGAAVNDRIARSIGADGYARDAVRAVGLVRKLLQKAKRPSLRT